LGFPQRRRIDFLGLFTASAVFGNIIPSTFYGLLLVYMNSDVCYYIFPLRYVNSGLVLALWSLLSVVSYVEFARSISFLAIYAVALMTTISLLLTSFNSRYELTLLDIFYKQMQVSFKTVQVPLKKTSSKVVTAALFSISILAWLILKGLKPNQ